MAGARIAIRMPSDDVDAASAQLAGKHFFTWTQAGSVGGCVEWVQDVLQEF